MDKDRLVGGYYVSDSVSASAIKLLDETTKTVGYLEGIIHTIKFINGKRKKFYCF